MKNDIERFQKTIGYSFNNPALLTEALTHRSFAMEHDLKFDNQRLEFLGDAVLQIILTEYLFEKYPSCDEGFLTKARSAMARETSLAKTATAIGLGEELFLGRGELETGGRTRQSTTADAFEALTGAIRLDGGMESAREFVLRIMSSIFPDPERLIIINNPKGEFQEFCQSHFKKTPTYKLIKVEGPDHDPHYTIEVHIDEFLLGSATESRRKSAESSAAAAAIENIASGKFPELEKRYSSENKNEKNEAIK